MTAMRMMSLYKEAAFMSRRFMELGNAVYHLVFTWYGLDRQVWMKFCLVEKLCRLTRLLVHQNIGLNPHDTYSMIQAMLN